MVIPIIDLFLASSVTESAARSRLIPAVLSFMADSSFLRDKAEQALRLARDTTDPVLIKSLKEFAAECLARADKVDRIALGEDPENI